MISPSPVACGSGARQSRAAWCGQPIWRVVGAASPGGVGDAARTSAGVAQRGQEQEHAEPRWRGRRSPHQRRRGAAWPGAGGTPSGGAGIDRSSARTPDTSQQPWRPWLPRIDVAWPREGAGASGAAGGRCSGGSTAVRAAAAPNPRRLRLAAAVPGPACRGRPGGCGPATASGLCSRSHAGRAWPLTCLAPACRKGERPRRCAQSQPAHRCRARPPRRTAAPCSAARPLPHLARAPQHRRTRPPPERIVGRG